MLSFKVLDSNKSLEVQKTLEDNVTTKGHKVVFTYRDELESFKIMQVYTVFKNKLYVLTYIAEFEKYSVYLPSIEGIMNSFKIINAMEYDKKDFLQYMDSTIGLKISYPYDWGKIKATNREVLFISPDKKIYFSIFTGIAQGRSLEAIAGGIINDDKIRANKLINPISEIIESKGTIVSGDPAYYRVNFYTDNASISPEDPLRHPEIKGIQIFTVAGDIRYSFLFFARDDVYSNYWPSIKEDDRLNTDQR